MDLSFDLVASKCAEQMAKYQQCVLGNQNADWAYICRPEGKALTECADASVPHLAELKRACANQIATYRGCLETNGAQPDDVVRERCAKSMKALWECSESKVAELERTV
ncbi:hypothetical protein Q8F55_004851 [Vanrija albida]|uniref:IMS import disulfide relay-system CHCH-CHCH-like Cx9C domain-containing protein n=1 Tax=Vanrija albida TaxID=181172 RepID=A0ABR3PZZ4_9TREE